MNALPQAALEVLDYWLGPDVAPDAVPTTIALWFQGGAAVDEHVKAHFVERIEAAGTGSLDDWAESPRGALALVILLDQFTRNAFRGTARSFAFDPKARSVARNAIERGLDLALPPVLRTFFYLPFEHEESVEGQRFAVEKTRAARDASSGAARGYLDKVVDYADRHRAIIERFGRFPHRNATLGRSSTGEEVEFLKGPGSSF